ncbi:MAG TPA: cyclic nucleotide-binding domain-containing protein [Terriglobales bacterium]|nr:cyclic nucleotide-binding domain-containing protein [Terriglobales bacterium]
MRRVLYYLGILDDTDVEWLVEHGTRKQVSAGSVLVQQDVPVQYLYIVLEGDMVVRNQPRNGEKSQDGAHIADLGVGDVVGELSLVDAHPPAASVIAQTNSWLLAVPHKALVVRLAKDTAFAARFYRAIAFFLADRLRATVRRFGYGDAHQYASEEEIPDSALDDMSLAAVRFDKVLRKLRGEYDPDFRIMGTPHS